MRLNPILNRTVFSAVIGLLALAGCTDARRSESQSHAVSPSPTVAAPAAQGDVAAALQGRWDVTALDGQPIRGIDLSSDGSTIWWEPGCAGQSRRFSVDGTAIKVAPPQQLQAVCDIGLPDQLGAVFAAIDAARTIEVTDDGRITLSGGHRLDLVRIAPLAVATAAPTPVDPDTPVSSSGPLPTPTTLAGEWKVAAIDGKDFNENYGLALSGSAREIWWNPRCAGMARSYTIAGTALTIAPALRQGPPPRAGDPPAPVCAIGLPQRLPEVVRALDAASRIERTPSNGILISGGGHSLLLFSQ